MAERTWDEIVADTRKHLDGGDARAALAALRAAIGYEGEYIRSDDRFRESMALFEQVAAALEFPVIVERISAVRAAPSSAEALFALGYELVEVGVNDVAANVLSRADRLMPGEVAIVTELACAYERDMRHARACDVLRSIPEAVEAEFAPRFLLCFNQVMSAELKAAETTLSGLRRLADPEGDNRDRDGFMVATIEGSSPAPERSATARRSTLVICVAGVTSSMGRWF